MLWIFFVFVGWVLMSVSQANMGGWMLTESADAWGRV